VKDTTRAKVAAVITQPLGIAAMVAGSLTAQVVVTYRSEMAGVKPPAPPQPPDFQRSGAYL